MHNYKKVIRSMLCIIMALFMLACSGFAVDISKFGTLEITCLVKEEPVKDVVFDVFYVADINTIGELKWDSTYEGYKLKLDLDDEAHLGTAASTLSGYIKRDSISPTDTGETNSQGIVFFDNMKEGLYLVVGRKYQTNSVKYTPVPTFVRVVANLPTELQVKYERATIKHETTERRVLKAWKDDGVHPESITVQLLKDGEVFHTKALNKDNNWRHEWTNLDADADWTIIESKVPEGYTMQTEQVGSTTVITNTKTPDTPVSTPPSTPTLKPQPEPQTPQPTPEAPTVKPTPTKLPQTGMLWWPVFVMAGAGVIFLILDLIRRKEDWEEWKKVVKRRKPFLLYLGSILIIGALGLACHNLMEDKNAGESASKAVYELRSGISASDTTNESTPDYILNPDMEMPQVKLNGNRYIGTISIPAFSVELPIVSECTPSNLKISPCLYKGSAYEDKMIIAGHNYTSHFGKLSNVKANDDVIITDIDGNVFNYKVVGTETIGGTDVEAMEMGDWNLSLFTCTPDGRSRVTVRCIRAETE